MTAFARRGLLIRMARDGAPDDATARLAAALEEEIIFGRLAPGARLVEESLGRRFEANRHIVRGALAELRRLGLIVCARNRGCRVRDYAPEELEGVYEIRETLQRRAAERMPLPAPPERLAALRAAQTSHDAAVARAVAEPDSAEALRAVFEANEAFHASLFEGCGNPHLAEAIRRYGWMTHAVRSHGMADSALIQRARSEHWAMVAAVERGDRAALAERVAAHIHWPKEAYLARLRAAAQDCRQSG